MDYKDTVICTVGASLLTNANRDSAPDRLKQLVNAFKEKDYTKANQLIAAIQDPFDKSLGAEINSIANIVKRELLTSRQQMYLLVSDTTAGEQTGEILKGYFEKNKNGLDFNSVKIVKIEKLNDKKRFEFKFYGLRNLVKEMARCIKESGNRCIINATGGYKATIAYSTLLGQALNVPVYYLFESFDEIIELLQVPVKLDTTLYRKYSRLFAMLEYENVVEEEKLLKKFDYASWAKVPEELKILLERTSIDSKYYLALNPLGQIYLESVNWDCSTIDDPAYKTEEAFEEKIRGSGGHAIKFREENWKIIEDIAKLPQVISVATTGSSEIESGNQYKVWIEGDHLRLSLSSKAGTGFFVIQTTVQNQKFLECVRKRIEKIIEERR